MENKFTKAIKEFAKKNNVKFHQEWEIKWIEKEAKDFHENCEFNFKDAIKEAFDKFHWVIEVGTF